MGLGRCCCLPPFCPQTMCGGRVCEPGHHRKSSGRAQEGGGLGAMAGMPHLSPCTPRVLGVTSHPGLGGKMGLRGMQG